MKRSGFIIIISALFAASVGLALLLPRIKHGTTANIYRGGECIYSVDLSLVSKSYTVDFDDGKGHVNTVEIAPGRIRVLEANCPDGVCVNTGWTDSPAKPIICLPAKLIIRISGEAPDGFDAVTGAAR